MVFERNLRFRKIRACVYSFFYLFARGVFAFVNRPQDGRAFGYSGNVGVYRLSGIGNALIRNSCVRKVKIFNRYFKRNRFAARRNRNVVRSCIRQFAQVVRIKHCFFESDFFRFAVGILYGDFVVVEFKAFPREKFRGSLIKLYTFNGYFFIAAADCRNRDCYNHYRRKYACQ